MIVKWQRQPHLLPLENLENQLTILKTGKWKDSNIYHGMINFSGWHVIICLMKGWFLYSCIPDNKWNIKWELEYHQF